MITQIGIGINKQYIAIVFLDKNLKPIDNVFYQLFAFYPSDKGTVFKEISKGFIEANPAIATISVSDLKDIAKAWYDKYHDVLHPSLIGFASYMENESGNIVLKTQSFTVNYDPLKILNGIGMTQPVVFNQAKALSITRNSIKPSYFTTTTTVPGFFCEQSCWYVYTLNWVVYYPSNNSLAPIPLIEVDSSDLFNYQQYFFGFVSVYMQQSTSTTLSFDISEGLETDYGGVSYDIPGPSITLSYGSISNAKNAPFGYGFPLTEDIYINAQLAYANYTVQECDICCCSNVGYSLQVMATALEVTSSNPSNSLPALFNTTTLYEPFNWSYANYYGSIGSGSPLYIVNLNLTSNVLPGIVISISTAIFLAAVDPELAAALAPILPHLNFILQTTNTKLLFLSYSWLINLVLL